MLGFEQGMLQRAPILDKLETDKSSHLADKGIPSQSTPCYPTQDIYSYHTALHRGRKSTGQALLGSSPCIIFKS